MAIPRHFAIVLCSCGMKWGNSRRASLHEEMMEVEHRILAAHVPVMARHFQLGHRFTLGESAPRELLDTIAKAAAAAKGEDEDGEAAPAVRGLLGPGDED